MKKILGLLLALSMGSAFAHGCPGEMKAIDAKLPSSAALGEAQISKVKDLRAKGEQLHKEGKHSDSMAALSEAKKILGL